MTQEPARPPATFKDTRRRLWALARPELGSLGVGTVALIIGASLSLVYPLAAQWMLDGINGDQHWISLNQVAELMLVLVIVQNVFVALRVWLYTATGERVVANLRKRLFSAILTRDTAFFDTNRTGELTSRLSSDTTILQSTVTVNVSMLLRFGAQAIGAATMMFVKSPKLTLLALVVVPVVAVSAALYGRMIRRFSGQVQDALATSTTVAEEAISSVRTVRSFAREEAEVERYGAAVQRSYSLAARLAGLNGVFQGATGIAAYWILILVVWYGGTMVVAGTMTTGELMAFVWYTGTVAVSFGLLSGLYTDFMRSVGATERVFALIDEVSSLESADGRRLDSVTGHVRFDAVTFAYPSRPDTDVLSEVSLELRPGEVVALVGPSGSGKSTVATLIARFYDPAKGSIQLDGVDVKELQPKWLREQVGAVSQEPVLFAASIRDNVRYGRPSASEDDVRAALKAANALGFVEQFPEGLDALVGERGVRLSGGQKQRIAIARALLKDPRVLVLDEATSALDTESEHLVQEALERLMVGRTTLVIAHRLSTVRDADRVVVLDRGRVVETGSHDELLDRDGLYRRLVERQFADHPTDPARDLRQDVPAAV